MKISTKGRYALRVMIDIAENGKEESVSVKDISERQNISKKYLEQILALLSKGGMISTCRGNKGGYRLTKSPSSYTVGEILRATEGDLSPLDCLNNASCARASCCKTHDFWAGLDAVIESYVDGKTLADLL